MSGPVLTASQTVGPFFAIGLTREDRPTSLKNVLVGPQSPGERIQVQGHVVDGDAWP